MNDQFNPVGTDQTEIATKENGRRRLVRGAVALAPLVLTLRSGALAAASCTGVKITGVDVRSGTPAERGGELLNPNPSKPIVAGDVCVEPGFLRQCGTDPNRVETLSEINRANTAPVSLRTPNNATEYWTCGNRREFQGQTVAILSSQSVASMGISRR